MSEEQLTQAEGERLEQRTREAASRIELERQLVVAQERNKDTQELLDRERDLVTDLRFQLGSRDSARPPFVETVWIEAFRSAIQLYRERGATVMEVVENSAIHANNAVSKAENHMISPVLKALVNRGLG